MRLLWLALMAAGLLLAAQLFFLRSTHAENPILAAKAQAVFQQHCAACHGSDGKNKGGFGDILDRDKLVERSRVVPGDANESVIFQRISAGEMPPAKQPRLKADEIAVLKEWIEIGAPSWGQATPQRGFQSDDSIADKVLADLKTLSPKQRKFTRYFTSYHLFNAGRGDKEIETSRVALGKLLNSLSWHPRIAMPLAVDNAIQRIDLRDFKWAASTWERVLREYPYKNPSGGESAKLIAKWTGTETAAIRADWFVATASQPPLYGDLLQLPATDRALERLLQLDVMQNIQDENAVRAGFNDSGVSKNNRMIERHDAAHGAYWRSYDFADNKGRQSLFEHPLGPAHGETSFKQDGGEMIWHLPNGLLAFMIVDKNGKRIDKAPVEIVADPQRPDQKVTTGLSCMSCHARGFLPKADQVRDHVLKNKQAFARGDVEAVLALYPPKDRWQKWIDEDNAKYATAMEKLGMKIDVDDPVNLVTRRYETPLDISAAAAEMGLTVELFRKRLAAAPSLARVLGPLAVKGGTVQRDVFQDSFAANVASLNTGKSPAATAGPVNSIYNPKWTAAPVQSVALSSDGHFGAAGSNKAVLLFETKGGQILRPLEGHKADVTALAFSKNGAWLASGGADRTVRIWDREHGKPTATLTGHTDAVRCVAFSPSPSPDGSLVVVSGSNDRTLRLWNWRDGKEIRIFAEHTGPVLAVAWAADGKWFVSASQDGTLRRWDAQTGQALTVLPGHVGAVHAVAVSPDGSAILSGGNDKTVRLWDVTTGKEKLSLTGHANSVIAVAFAANGTKCLSASSQYRQTDALFRQWDLKTGKEDRRWGQNYEGSVGCAALGADFTLIGGDALRRLNHDTKKE